MWIFLLTIAFLGFVLFVIALNSDIRATAWDAITGVITSVRVEKTLITTGVRNTLVVTVQTDDGRLIVFPDPPRRRHAVGEHADPRRRKYRYAVGQRIERGRVVVSVPRPAPRPADPDT